MRELVFQADILRDGQFAEKTQILEKHTQRPAAQAAPRRGGKAAAIRPVEEYLPRVILPDAVEEVESCSACYGYLIPALEMLKEEGLFEKLDEKICIGQGYRGKKGVLGVGHCTCKFQNYVEGCPPLEGDIYEFLKGYIGERTPGK